MNTENTISKTKNILLVLPSSDERPLELRYLVENFCGATVNSLTEIHGDLNQQRLYVCGDLNDLESDGRFLYVIRELSKNYENCDPEKTQIVALGVVPVLICNAGVYFRQLFEEDDYFDRIKAEHQFQDLTESNKPGMALRKGIYLSEVSREETTEKNEILHYHLLRCSSNLSGPTDNFRATDHKIIKAIREAARSVFEKETSLNHVLAQIYENKKRIATEDKETKARIKAHSDKTKDMPQDALIAFCTFYDRSNFQQLKRSAIDQYDWCYKQGSALTKLHFKLKNSVSDENLEKEFTVVLYPNSVFFIPLSTNRLYTHEIRPSMLDVDKIPTRMGYVVRCSIAEAVFMNEQAYIKENGALVPLEEMTQEGTSDLKTTYREENITENRIQYGKVHFSLNSGDYLKPIY